MVSQLSGAMFFDNCGRKTIDDLKEPKCELTEMFYAQKKNIIDVFIDPDSTHFDPSVNRRNQTTIHYGTTGYHIWLPILL